MHFFRKSHLASTNPTPENAALNLLELKWERTPSPSHDYLFYISRSPDNLRMATASSDSHTDHVTEIWEIPERRMSYRLQTPGASAISLEWLKDEAFVTAGHDSLLTIRREDSVLGQ